MRMVAVSFQLSAVSKNAERGDLEGQNLLLFS
jgi:hypothetical protein